MNIMIENKGLKYFCKSPCQNILCRHCCCCLSQVTLITIKCKGHVIDATMQIKEPAVGSIARAVGSVVCTVGCVVRALTLQTLAHVYQEEVYVVQPIVWVVWVVVQAVVRAVEGQIFFNSCAWCSNCSVCFVSSRRCVFGLLCDLLFELLRVKSEWS